MVSPLVAQVPCVLPLALPGLRVRNEAEVVGGARRHLLFDGLLQPLADGPGDGIGGYTGKALGVAALALGPHRVSKRQGRGGRCACGPLNPRGYQHRTAPGAQARRAIHSAVSRRSLPQSSSTRAPLRSSVGGTQPRRGPRIRDGRGRPRTQGTSVASANWSGPKVFSDQRPGRAHNPKGLPTSGGSRGMRGARGWRCYPGLPVPIGLPSNVTTLRTWWSPAASISSRAWYRSSAFRVACSTPDSSPRAGH